MSPPIVTVERDTNKDPSSRFGTDLVHIGSAPDAATSAVIPAISLSTTFAQSVPGIALNPNVSNPFFEYSRSLNPNRLALERLLESLELSNVASRGGDHGATDPDRLPNALTFASGSSVTQAIVQAVAGHGGHIVSGSDVYGGTFRYLTKVAPTLQNVETTFVNMTLQPSIDDSDGSNVSSAEADLENNLNAAFRPNTKLVWLETPSNPTLLIASISSIARIAHSHGALLVVDNTFLSPFYQRPISKGADVVVHSLTKYVNGHSDVVMGALISPHTELIDKLRFIQNAGGAIPSPFDAWMVLRGAKTLELRMKQHGKSALEISEWLQDEGKKNGWVREVIYPGLKRIESSLLQDRIREIAWNQLSNQAKEFETLSNRDVSTSFTYGGMVSIRVGKKGDSSKTLLSKATTFLKSLKIFTLAESLGGVESLVELPAVMTHASLTPEAREKLGIDEGLVRLSVGIEDVRDLKNDLRQAFQIASQVKVESENGVTNGNADV